METEREVSLYEVRQAIKEAEGVVLNEQPYPTPLACTDQDMVEVGRLRRDLASEQGIALWCCGDQLRKGAATNAVEIGPRFVAGAGKPLRYGRWLYCEPQTTPQRKQLRKIGPRCIRTNGRNQKTWEISSFFREK